MPEKRFFFHMGLRISETVYFIEICNGVHKKKLLRRDLFQNVLGNFTRGYFYPSLSWGLETKLFFLQFY